MNDRIDARARSAAGVGIADVELDDLMTGARGVREMVGTEICQTEPVAVTVRPAERAPDAPCRAGKEDEAATRVRHARVLASLNVMLVLLAVSTPWHAGGVRSNQ
jgi:hypothetical protein